MSASIWAEHTEEKGRTGVSDLDEIRRIIAISAEAFDTYDDERWLECLTEDHVFVVDDRRFETKAEVAALTASLAGDGTGGRGMHVLGEPLITVEPTRVWAVTRYLYVDEGAEDRFEITAAGHYVDDFVRDDTGRWLCAARRNVHHKSPGAVLRTTT